MAKYFKPDTELGMEAECAVCCCIWTDPLEVLPCQHIFCRACIETLDKCPTCCGDIHKTRRPNNALLRMLQRTPGSCSACEWKGVLHDFNENHKVCWKNGQPPLVEEVSSGQYMAGVPGTNAMEDYFMQDTPAVAPSFWPAPATSDAKTNSTATTSTTSALAKWKSQQRGHAKEYGLRSDELDALVDKFADMATAKTPDGEPALTWRDACRLLRFFNYPNHPDDVRDLFLTSGQSTDSGAIPFHAVCTWIPLNRRSPQQWYGMPADAYEALLMMALVLDENSTGLFTLEQARLLAEQYFERDVPDSEWAVIGPMVRERASMLRQAFPDVVMDENGRNTQELTLPFHDVLLSFMRYVEMMKRSQHGSQRQPARPAVQTAAPIPIQQRIRKMVEYYDPDALPSLPSTLQNFKGEEADLLMTFIAMYGPEPSST